MSEFYGVDVSSYNGKPDWSKAAKELHFAILRVTEKYGVDTSFEHNYAGCSAAGIKIGVYKFSYATDAASSKREAEGVIAALKGRKLDFPVFLDLEWNVQESYGKVKMAQIIEAFRKVIVDASYKFGIYCNDYWYKCFIPDEAKQHDFWVAIVPAESSDNGTVQEKFRPKYGVGWQYSWAKRVDGFLGKVDADVFYTDYSSAPLKGDELTDGTTQTETELPKTKGVTAEDILNVARSWLGRNEKDGTHKMIIDLYNLHKPLARGYTVSYYDAWCDTFISALYIKMNAVELIGGTECGVEQHIEIFKREGIWIEDGKITPKPGYLVCYNWDDSTQPNDGYADHIGIVESVSDGYFTVIEGNYNDSVKRRRIPIGYGYIRGFAAPKYADESSVVKPSETSSAATGGKLSKEPKWVGKVSASALNVRSWAGTENPNIKSWPILLKDNLVDVCDTVYDSKGKPWYYVRIQGKIYGFCSAEFIVKA